MYLENDIEQLELENDIEQLDLENDIEQLFVERCNQQGLSETTVLTITKETGAWIGPIEQALEAMKNRGVPIQYDMVEGRIQNTIVIYHCKKGTS